MDAKKFNKLIGMIDERKAFDILYKFYYPKIVNHIYFTYFAENLGEDVAQEFFAKLLENKSKLKPVEYPTTWVYKVCDNIIKDIFESDDKYHSAFCEGEEDLKDRSYEKILFGEYGKLFDKLDALTRKIILMYYYEGYSMKEISVILGESYDKVRQRCSRGIKQLKKFF